MSLVFLLFLHTQCDSLKTIQAGTVLSHAEHELLDPCDQKSGPPWGRREVLLMQAPFGR